MCSWSNEYTCYNVNALLHSEALKVTLSALALIFTERHVMCVYHQYDTWLIGGGDWPECYELVLYEARTKLSWSPGTQRSLVMIGDAIPHDTSYPMNEMKLDWKKEAARLHTELGVRIYSVHPQVKV